MYCKKCGNELIENEQVCRNCGESVYVPSNNDNINNFKLTLSRKKSFIASLVAFDIFIDQVKVGKIKNGETLDFDITAGKHIVSINNNDTEIMIDKNTTADVVVFGSNDFGITNINGQGLNSTDSKSNESHIKKNINMANSVLYASIILPLISLIMYFTTKYFLQSWFYGIIIGYGLVNIAGFKNLKSIDNDVYKRLMKKNTIAIVISIVSLILTTYISVNLT